MSETSESTETPDAAESTESESSDTDGTEQTKGPDSKDETTGPDPRLLEELDEHIRGARTAAEDALGGTGQTFVESGDEPAEEEDDQTIAPPG